jgi:hypothetical protein
MVVREQRLIPEPRLRFPMGHSKGIRDRRFWWRTRRSCCCCCWSGRVRLLQFGRVSRPLSRSLLRRGTLLPGRGSSGGRGDSGLRDGGLFDDTQDVVQGLGGTESRDRNRDRSRRMSAGGGGSRGCSRGLALRLSHQHQDARLQLQLVALLDVPKLPPVEITDKVGGSVVHHRTAVGGVIAKEAIVPPLHLPADIDTV